MTKALAPAALIDALMTEEPATSERRTDIRIVRAPGRVNLIGEHTDYNEGFVLPAAIDLEIHIAYLPTDDRHVELVRLDGGERDGFDLDEPRPRAGTWLDYVVGTAWALGEAGLPLTGLRGVIASTLPPNAGLSSSAAIELASAWAMLDSSRPDDRPVPPRPALPARRERLRRGPERAHGPVRRIVRRGRLRRLPRLPIARLATGRTPGRRGARRLSHRGRLGTSTAPRTTSAAASARRPSTALARTDPVDPQPARRDPGGPGRRRRGRPTRPDPASPGPARRHRERPGGSDDHGTGGRRPGRGRPPLRRQPCLAARPVRGAVRRSWTRWSRSPSRCRACSPRG